jgi:hypothetical protein
MADDAEGLSNATSAAMVTYHAASTDTLSITGADLPAGP